uniref:NADH-ubiquinone oxidoreductase chain 6 n=1 Tax=Scolytinae sp. BMNH 1039990 TaxID=1903772 RepID=A0A343A4N2_9CUCU|nr:NADH dehydrogenase subunit 6 [Scolytinae sp. BMNH 1039990]
MLLIMTMNWSLATVLMSTNHPLAMGSILLMQTILIALSSGFMFTNFWLSYILFLIMVGGMLIMFMYMTSIASNEKFKLPKLKMMLLTLSLIMLMISMIMFIDKSLMAPAMKMSLKLTMNEQTYASDFFVSTTKFFNLPNFTLSIALMLYLLLTLIAVVKITNKKMGPLRQK